MDQEIILEELLALLEKLNIAVKYDRGSFKGGLVRYHEQDYFYLNRKTEITAKINLILNELKQIDLPESILSERLKKMIFDNGELFES